MARSPKRIAMEKSSNKFQITESGAWSGDVSSNHRHDPSLASQLVIFFKSKTF